MPSRCGRVLRAASGLAFAAIPAAVGCGDLLGFQHSLLGCLRDTDCKDRKVCRSSVCEVECLLDADCTSAGGEGSVCRESVCFAPSPSSPVTRVSGNVAQATVTDASTTGQGDSSCGDTTSSVERCGSCDHACTGKHVRWACVASGCVANGCEPGRGDCNGDPSDGCEADLTSDPDNCGRCGAPACASFVCDDANQCASNVCDQGVCRRLDIPGLSSQRGPTSVLVQDHTFIGFPIDVSAGWLTAFGMITEPLLATAPDGGSMTVNAHALLGLYTDVKGYPGDLVAVADGAKELTTAAGSRQLFPVSPPVYLTTQAYWIVGAFDQFINFNASAGQVTIAIAAYPGDAGPALAPLPRTAPQASYQCQPPTAPCNIEPALYIVVAR